MPDDAKSTSDQSNKSERERADLIGYTAPEGTTNPAQPNQPSQPNQPNQPAPTVPPNQPEPESRPSGRK